MTHNRYPNIISNASSFCNIWKNEVPDGILSFFMQPKIVEKCLEDFQQVIDIPSQAGCVKAERGKEQACPGGAGRY